MFQQSSHTFKSTNNDRPYVTFDYPMIVKATYRDGNLDIQQDEIDKYTRKEIQDLVDINLKDERVNIFEAQMTSHKHYFALNMLPAAVGTKWKITEEIHDYFYEMMPPMRYKRGFCMCEANSGTIHSNYYGDSNGNYWHEWVDISK